MWHNDPQWETAKKIKLRGTESYYLVSFLFPPGKSSFQYPSWKDLGRDGYIICRAQGTMKVWGPSWGQGSQSPFHINLLLPNLLQVESCARPHLIPGWDSGNDPMESSTEHTGTLYAVECVPDLDPSGSREGSRRREMWPPPANSNCTPERSSSSGRPELGEFQGGHPRALNPKHRALNPQQGPSEHETPWTVLVVQP